MKFVRHLPQTSAQIRGISYCPDIFRPTSLYELGRTPCVDAGWIGRGFSPTREGIGLLSHQPSYFRSGAPINRLAPRRFGPNYTILTRPNEQYEEAHSPRCRIRIWYQVRIACQALFTLFLTFFCERDLAGFLARQDIGQDIQGHGSDKEKGKQGKHPCNSPHHRIVV